MPDVLRSKRSPVRIGPGVFHKTYGLLSLENGVVDFYQLGLNDLEPFYCGVW
jgi:hypothetical protein